MDGIHLWWIGEKEASPRMIEHVRMHLERAFGWPIRMHAGTERPREATRVPLKGARARKLPARAKREGTGKKRAGGRTRPAAPLVMANGWAK